MGDNETRNETVTFGQLLEGAPDFDVHEKTWLRTHSAERPRKRIVGISGLLSAIFLLAIIFIGAALVSGAHSIPALLFTIPEVVQSPIREALAIAGFTVFELMIFTMALFRRESILALIGLVISFVGALMANLGSSIASTTANNGSGFDMFVAVVLAALAPTAALLVGELLHKKLEQFFANKRAADEEYAAAWVVIQRRIRDEYTRKYVKRARKSTKLREKEVSHNEFREVSQNTAKPYEPRKSVREIARKVHENGDHTLRGREIARKYGVTDSSASKIKDLIATWEKEGRDHVQ